jgi:hypothetical protein
METLSGRQYSFQKLTQFSQENTVLDALPSNIDIFISRGTCVSSTQLSRPIWKKCPFYPFKTLMHRQNSFQKLTRFTQRNNMLHVPASNIDAFLSQIHVFFHLILIGPFATKHTFVPIENPDGQAVFLSETNSIVTGKQ